MRLPLRVNCDGSCRNARSCTVTTIGRRWRTGSGSSRGRRRSGPVARSTFGQLRRSQSLVQQRRHRREGGRSGWPATTARWEGGGDGRQRRATSHPVRAVHRLGDAQSQPPPVPPGTSMPALLECVGDAHAPIMPALAWIDYQCHAGVRGDRVARLRFSDAHAVASQRLQRDSRFFRITTEERFADERPNDLGQDRRLDPASSDRSTGPAVRCTASSWARSRHWRAPGARRSTTPPTKRHCDEARHGPPMLGRGSSRRDQPAARRAHGHRDRRVQRGGDVVRGRMPSRPRVPACRRQPGARGPGHRRLHDHARLRRRDERPGAVLLRGLDAGRRGHPREDGQHLAPRASPRTTATARPGRWSSSEPSTVCSTSGARAARTATRRFGLLASSARWPASRRKRSTRSPRCPRPSAINGPPPAPTDAVPSPPLTSPEATRTCHPGRNRATLSNSSVTLLRPTQPDLGANLAFSPAGSGEPGAQIADAARAHIVTDDSGGTDRARPGSSPVGRPGTRYPVQLDIS